MTTLPPELAMFASLLDAHLCLRHRCRQPAPVRDAYNYCLCLLMAEAGVMRLVGTVPGENGEVCVFESIEVVLAVICLLCMFVFACWTAGQVTPMFPTPPLR